MLFRRLFDPLRFTNGRVVSIRFLSAQITVGKRIAHTSHCATVDDPGRAEAMGPNNNIAELAAVVRHKIATGVLPTATPTKVWVGKGMGRLCDACDLTVTSADIEYETDLPCGRTLRFHQPCFTVWHEARVKSQIP
jgi:hypothetical protein